MADHTQTIINYMPLAGHGEAQYWNVITWGTDQWGWDPDMVTDTVKAPDMANLNLSVALGQDVVFEGTGNTMDLADAVGKDFVKEQLTETITFASSIESIMRTWGIWDYVFTKPTSDGDEKVFDTFSKVSDGSDDFTQVSDGSTDWTGV